MKRLALEHAARVEAKMAELRPMRDAILHLAGRAAARAVERGDVMTGGIEGADGIGTEIEVV